MAGASAGNRVRKASRMAADGKKSLVQRLKDGVRNVAGRVRNFFR